MNYTQEQLAALSDNELNLIIAQIQHPRATIYENKVYKYPLSYFHTSAVTLEYHLAPDYLHDLNAIDDLCKQKGFIIYRIPELDMNLPYPHIYSRFAVHNKHGFILYLDDRLTKTRNRVQGEALVLADQESKK